MSVMPSHRCARRRRFARAWHIAGTAMWRGSRRRKRHRGLCGEERQHRQPDRIPGRHIPKNTHYYTTIRQRSTRR